jgi:hypothetical protein
MAKRISTKDLQAVVDRINYTTGNPTDPWTRDDNGNITANVGVYFLSGAYGGHSLHKMANTSGGVVDVLRCGHVPARDLYNRMHSYIEGMYVARG